MGVVMAKEKVVLHSGPISLKKETTILLWCCHLDFKLYSSLYNAVDVYSLTKTELIW